MALQMVCDGNCKETIPADTKPAGRLEPCFYCPACRAEWAAAEAEIEAARLQAIQTFEATRAEVLARARAKLGKLPDE